MRISTCGLRTATAVMSMAFAWRLPAGVARAAEVVLIEPGSDIPAVVNSHPAGTTFFVKAGIYRMQQIHPRDGDAFIGELGAVLCGAKVLAGFQPAGEFWSVGGQTQQGWPHGETRKGYERAKHPEELFFDDVPFRHVDSVAKLGPGKWYFDYERDTIYVGEDPAGHEVETSVVAYAFSGKARDVAIRGFRIEKYTNRAQHGAIHIEGPGWVVEDCEIRHNHGVGIVGHDASVVRNNYIYTNGFCGFGGTGRGGLYEGNEVRHNNFANFSPGWSAGGSKWAHTTNLTVKRNYVHHNDGPGLWTDINNIGTSYVENLVVENGEAGIFHEISYKAVIKDNIVRRNSIPHYPWLYGSQILLSASRDVEVTGNVVEVAAEGGNAIGLIQQERGTGKYGKCLTINNKVHHNDVTHLGAIGQSGLAGGEYAEKTYGTCSFDHNTFHVLNAGKHHWGWNNHACSWSGFRKEGQEAHGYCDSLVYRDVVPPKVRITSPEGGSRIEGKVTITVDAADRSGVNRVRFACDGYYLGTATEKPFTLELDARRLAAGRHEMEAVAVDVSGNESASEAVAFASGPEPELDPEALADEPFPSADDFAAARGALIDYLGQTTEAGKRPTGTIRTPMGSARATVLRADDTGVKVRAYGTQLTLQWDRIDSRELAMLVKRCAEESNDADALFCVGLLFHEAGLSEARDEIGAKLAALDAELAARLDEAARNSITAEASR